MATPPDPMDVASSQDEELPPRPAREPPNPPVTSVTIGGIPFDVVDYNPPPTAVAMASAIPTTTGELAQCSAIAAVLPESEGTPPMASSPTSMDVTSGTQSDVVPSQQVFLASSSADSSEGEDWWYDRETRVWYHKQGARGTWIPWVESGAPPAKRQRQDKPEGEK